MSSTIDNLQKHWQDQRKRSLFLAQSRINEVERELEQVLAPVLGQVLEQVLAQDYHMIPKIKGNY